jgi:hypothetical protein
VTERLSRAIRSFAVSSAAMLLAASMQTLAAQAMPRDSMAKPLLLDQRAPDLSRTPTSTSAPSRRVVRTRWEHGALTIGNGSNNFRWAGPGQTFVESRNAVEFLLALGADPSTRLRAGRGRDEVQAAILGELGRQHWELVSCQYIRNDDGDHMTLCYLKRPFDVSP